MPPSAKRKAESERGQGKPKSAEAKTIKKPKVSDFQDANDSSGDEQVPLAQSANSVKKAAAASGSESPKENEEESKVMIHTNYEGEKYIDIGKKKRVTVRKFKGNVLIDIREYWGEEGDEKPGKKGISLSTEQWKNLTEAAEAVDIILAKMK